MPIIMDISTRIKNRLAELSANAQDAMSSFVAPEDIVQGRMSICEICPELLPTTKTCKKCGCFMTMKTRLNMASCPLSKW